MITIRRIAWLAAPLAFALVIACGGGGDTGTTSEPGPIDAGTTAANPAESPTTPTPTRTATVPAGQAIEVTIDVFGSRTVVEFTISEVKAGVKSGNQFIKPQRGQFITCKATVVAKVGKYPANPYDFKLVGPDGTVYENTIGVAEPTLGAAELSSGQRTSGYLTFDAAPGAEKGRIAVKNTFAEGDAGYWTLS